MIYHELKLNFLLVMMFILGVLSILFLCRSLLMVLLIFEYFVFVIFFFLMSSVMFESVFELLFYLVIIVGESVLGLLLLVIKVMITGSELMSSLDVI